MIKGEDLRMARKMRQMTRKQAAKALSTALGRSVNQATVHEWERGDRRLPENIRIDMLDPVSP